MFSKSAILKSAALIACLVVGNSAYAKGAADLLGAIKASNATGSDTLQVSYLKNLILVTDNLDSNVPDDQLRRRAGLIGRAIASKQRDDLKPLTILFQDRSNNVKEISFDLDQVRSFAGGDDSFVTSVAMSAAEQANSSGYAPAPASYGAMTVAAASSIKSSNSQFQAERAKVAGRIEVLKAKGVGINPFVDELSKIDDQYKRADVGGATLALQRLDSVIDEQEKARKEAQTALANRPAPSAQVVAPKAAPGGRQLAAAAPGGSVITQFNGTTDDFVDQVVNQIVNKELGQFVPHKGPFMVERFRIAKRLKELEDQRMNVNGYATMYRNMEDIVASKDGRRLNELSMNVQYLQQQLGLAQLQGKLHRSLNL